MSSAKVSVVMPAYNGGKFLAQSIECVLAQTFTNWELVVVNNNSSDDTGAIAEAYAQYDERIRVVHNAETVSVIDNHNIAVAQAATDADWCKVLHVDDSMTPDTLELMTGLGEHCPRAGVVGSWTIMGEQVLGKILPLDQCLFRGAEVARKTLLGEVYPFQSPSCLLIRADLIRARQRFYMGDGLHADVDAAYSFLQAADYAVVQKPLITVGRPDESVTTSVVLPSNKLLAANLELLLTHGPVFLTEQEFEGRVEEHLAGYRDFLSKCVLEGRDAAFWAFHFDALSRLGYPLSRWRLVGHIFQWIVDRPRRLLHHTAKRFGIR